jgi:hypothetical protein
MTSRSLLTLRETARQAALEKSGVELQHSKKLMQPQEVFVDVVMTISLDMTDHILDSES